MERVEIAIIGTGPAGVLKSETIRAFLLSVALTWRLLSVTSWTGWALKLRRNGLARFTPWVVILPCRSEKR